MLSKNFKFIVEKNELDKRLSGFCSYVAQVVEIKTRKQKIQINPKYVGASFGIKNTGLILRAKYEALERLALQKKDFANDEILFEYPLNSQKDCVNLEEVILYENSKNKNFPFLNIHIKQKTPWVQVLDLNKKVHYVPYHYVAPRGKFKKSDLLDTWNTNGGAAHISIERAILNGVLELNERDSTMCSWKLKSFYCKVNISSITSKEFSLILKKFNKNNIDLEVYAIKNELNILTIVARIIKNDENFYSFGSACDADLEKAICKSIYEAVMIRNTQYLLIEDEKLISQSSLLEHIYSTVRNGKSKYAWINLNLKSLNLKDMQSIQPKTNKLIFELISGKFNFFYHIFSDLYSVSDVEVVKCIIPDFFPLEQGCKYKYRSDIRLLNFSGSNGFNYNKQIHPYG